MSTDGTNGAPLWLVVLLAVLLILYSLFDVAYFTRMAYTILRARYFRTRLCILEKTEMKSWCFLNDVDTLLYHMNNARYLRELDFARAEFYERTGLYASIKQAGGGVVQAATTVRYRRFIKPSTIFTITSKAVYWDDKTIFMDHEFVSADGFVNAVATCRQRVVGCTAASVVNLLHEVNCGGTCKAVMPAEMPPEIVAWVQANDISSAKLRKPECKCDPEKCQCLPTQAVLVASAENAEKLNGHVNITMENHNLHQRSSSHTSDVVNV